MKQRFYASIALLLVAVLTAALLCGCHSKPENSSDETSSVGSVPTTESDSNSMPAITPDESSEDTTPNGTNGSVAGKEHTPASFTACSINTSQLGTFRYWLYTPSDPTENMPLIVYLHGGSGKGDDLNLITAVDGFPQYLQSGQLGDVRAYVVIPQLPSTQKGWVNAAESISELIDHTVSTYKINRNNISLTGHSMGGTGTWNLACTYPSLFARIAPLSGSIRNTPDIIDNLKNISPCLTVQIIFPCRA